MTLAPPVTMPAWVVAGPDRIGWRDDAPAPALRPGTARVAVEWAAPNFADNLQIAGTYQERPDPPFVPGLELAGVVVDTAGPHPRISVGDRVVGLPCDGFGAWGATALAELDELVHVPDALSTRDAVAAHIPTQTAWFALVHRGGLEPGHTVLVHGAAGGVGAAGVQVARQRGGRVIATCSAAKAAGPARLGADLVLDRADDDWPAQVLAATDGQGVDVVLDPVGGAMFAGSTRCIAFEGRIVSVGFASGDVPTARLNHALVKNYDLVGLYWRPYLRRRPELVAAAAEELLGLVAAGEIDPNVTDEVPIREAPEAAAAVAAGRTTGRIVARW